MQNTISILLKSSLFQLIMLLTGTAAIYSITLGFPFYFDDYITVINNFNIRDYQFFQNIKHWLNPNYRSFSLLTFAWNYQWHQLDVSWYRFWNVCIHLLNTLWVFFIAKRLFVLFSKNTAGNSSSNVAFWVAAIFALHPLQSHTVMYISQRMALLSAFFYLGAFALWMVLLSEWFKLSIWKKLVLVLAIGICFLLGLQSKQNMASFPATALVFQLLFYKDVWKKMKYWWLGGAIVLLLLFLTVGKSFLLNYTSIFPEIDRSTYLLTQGYVCFHYILWLIVPYFQTIDPYVAWVEKLSDTRMWLALALGLAVLLSVFLLVKSKRYAYLFLLLFLIFSLSIESSLFPIKDALAVHRLYLPLLPVSMALVMFIQRFSVFLKGFILAYLVAFTFFNFSVWKSEKALWQHAVDIYKNNARPKNNLGLVYFAESNAEQAKLLFEEAIATDSTYYPAWVNLGNYHLQNQAYEVAIHYFQKSILLQPANAEALNNIGLCWKKLDVPSEALKYFTKACNQEFTIKEAFYNKAVAEEALGKTQEAILSYQKALLLERNYAEAHYNLGNLLMQNAAYSEAEKHFSAALSINETDDMVLNNLGIVHFHLKDFEKSKFYFEEAIRLNPSNINAFNNLKYLLQEIKTEI